ncbi:MAG TPA: PLP-dependent aspartate aminotransferase family protein [Acidobacteriota bacterium]|nr:PLP-dependent aspartate aminotransferase family protein [Acidobacteriota bacterium]
MGFATDAIHAGQKPDPTTGSVTIPIYQTSTYAQETIGKHKGFEYARTQNPTRFALERNVAVLEKGYAGFAFASGMAAISSVCMLLKSGDHVIVTENVYGGTYRLFQQIFTNLGLQFEFVDTSELENIRKAMKNNTRMVYVETPTNPLLTLTDLRLTANFCGDMNFLMVVDNTFMSPYFQKPLSLGADIVVHSTTKYLNGHSDGVGGIAVVSRKELAEKLAYVQNAAGAILSPFDSWLVLRGIKTLALRMQKHEENAKRIAEYLSHVKKVRKVFYPGLPDHPQHDLCRKQCTGFGGMISFDVGTLENARTIVENLKIFTFAESLGGVESLVGHPVSMTHASVPKERRQKLGLTDGIVRLSVGVEDVEDLIGDLSYAFDRI